jgi:O-antigen ligase/tetratricopeptide (TPR) repeat protein
MKTILRRIVLGGLFLIPFIPFLVSSSFFFPFITSKAFAWRILVELVFAVWAILVLVDPESRPKYTKILISFGVFLAIIGLADLFGAAPVKSFWSNFERMEGFISLLHLGAFIVVAGSAMKEREWTWWWNTTLVASAMMVFYCLAQLSGNIQINQGGVRVDGTFGNSAYLAVYLLIHLFVALIFFMRTSRKSFLRWVYGALAIALAIILYYTATRGAILGLLGGLVLAALLNVTNKHHKRARKVSLGVIIGFVVLVLGFFAIRHTSFVENSKVLSRFSSISVNELKTEGRSFIWPMALQGIKERPLLGWGQENFNYVFDEHYSPKMFALEPWFDRAHNIFLDWAVAGGLLGLLSYLSLYVFLLIAIWKDLQLSRVEKSLFTGMIAAYFFHNFFVFDNLGSYILFGALLAYIHSRTPVKVDAPKVFSENTALISIVPVGIVLIVVLYFGNIQPINANMDLIYGLQATQSDASLIPKALGYFQSSYNESRLGRPEAVEWISTSANAILNANIPQAEKDNYFNFAKTVVTKEAEEFSTDARYQLVAGSFFSSTGHPDDALPYLLKAQKLIPGKQEVYFQLAQTYLSKNDPAQALNYFKQAYEMEPSYTEAASLYLVGAIYAHNPKVANEALAHIPPATLYNDDRVANALYTTGQYGDLVSLLQNRLAANPDNNQTYTLLALAYAKAGDITNAIKQLRALEAKDPNDKDQIEQYIKQVQSGKF